MHCTGQSRQHSNALRTAQDGNGLSPHALVSIFCSPIRPISFQLITYPATLKWHALMFTSKTSNKNFHGMECSKHTISDLLAKKILRVEGLKAVKFPEFRCLIEGPMHHDVLLVLNILELENFLTFQG
ncbi:hypothetical protein VNO77_00668 [Canavalia gladiata]|uniref:Uncharacterized protein n=1 Tax=Canavalia gladiata TaxID=3824 RepID=A0AAN9R1J1_CANGL